MLFGCMIIIYCRPRLARSRAPSHTICFVQVHFLAPPPAGPKMTSSTEVSVMILCDASHLSPRFSSLYVLTRSIQGMGVGSVVQGGVVLFVISTQSYHRVPVWVENGIVCGVCVQTGVFVASGHGWRLERCYLGVYASYPNSLTVLNLP